MTQDSVNEYENQKEITRLKNEALEEWEYSHREAEFGKDRSGSKIPRHKRKIKNRIKNKQAKKSRRSNKR